MNRLYVVSLLSLLIASATSGYGQTVGRVFQDNAGQNVKNGLVNVVVKAYNAQGQLMVSASTDATGSYRLNLPAGHRVRLEFSGLPKGFTAVPGQAKVHFVTSPAQVDLALWKPGQYMGLLPQAVQAIYASGDSAAALAAFATSTDKASSSSLTTWATTAQTGALWGLAYERNSRRLFAAAFAKRHARFGPLGSGGIYVTTAQAPKPQSFIDLSALGIPTAPGQLPRDVENKGNRFSHDSLMFSLVGKVGLGGMDVSEDGQYLWVMNLFNRTLYRITLSGNGQTPTTGDVKGFVVPNPGYRHGQHRPFAVKYFDGRVYVGLVNDATGNKATSSDLKATVLAFDPVQETFDEIFSTSLNYTRGSLDYGVANWRPWTDDYHQALLPQANGWMIYPQPILADIEFDTDGSMILGLMDRLGHQTGEGQWYLPKGSIKLQQVRGLAGGDVLRVAHRLDERGKHRYELEHNGQAGDRSSAGQGNGEGPDGGEFYFDDTFKANGVTWHHETATGGLALLPDQDQLLVAAREPETGGYLGGGVKWFNNRTGAAEKGLSLLSKNQISAFGKANNVGDIELITEIPPTEIGDRVWQDCDEDGQQDADEAPLAGVTLGLYKEGELLATTISDKAGRYSFDSRQIEGGLQARTTYEVRVAMRQSAFPTLQLTKLNAAQDGEIDNDGVLDQDYAVARLTTTIPGESIHRLDFGFKCLDKPVIVAKLSCEGQVATLTLSGQKPDERIDFVSDRVYTGSATYEKATTLPQNGQLLSTKIADWSDEMTIRVFNQSGCFSDVYIKRSDATGCESTSKTEEVLGLLISPNPTSDYVSVRYRSKNQQGTIQLQIVDLQGRTLIDQSGTLREGRYNTQLNLGQQPTGSYVITILDAGVKVSRTLIKR